MVLAPNLLANDDYTLAELARYAEHYAGIDENAGPTLNLNENDQAIVEEYKHFIQDYQKKMAEYNAIPRRERDRQREYVKVNFGLDQLDFPELEKVGKFVNFYWFHKSFSYEKEGTTKQRFDESTPDGKLGKASKRQFNLSPEEYKEFLASHKGPGWHKFYGMSEEEYIAYLQTNWSAETTTPCYHPEFKTVNRRQCDTCWRDLQKKLLVYDMEDWDAKKEHLQTEVGLAKRTGRNFKAWQECVGYLQSLESQGHL